MLLIIEAARSKFDPGTGFPEMYEFYLKLVIFF